MMLDGRLQGYLLLRIRAGKEAETLAYVENTWKQYSHRYPMEYFFFLTIILTSSTVQKKR
jgi:hypothetical protein